MARKPDIEKRDAILSAAQTLMQQRGVHNTSMSDIAKALGMKRPTLYWYFKDMGAIFDALLERILSQQTAYVSERLRGIAHPIDLLYANLRAIHEFYEHRGELLMFLTQLWGVGASAEPGRALDIMERHFKPRREAAKTLLRQGIAKGTVAHHDPDALVELVGALVDGLLVHRMATTVPIAGCQELIWEHILAPLKISASDEKTTA